MGREGKLESGAKEEPNWLELGPLEGTADIWPVCLSRSLVMKDGLLPLEGCRDSLNRKNMIAHR